MHNQMLTQSASPSFRGSTPSRNHQANMTLELRPIERD